MKRIAKCHYAWIICIICVLILFCTIGLVSSAFSVYLPYLIKFSGLSNTQSSMVVTMRNLFALISMVFVGRFYKKFEYRIGLSLATLMTAASFFLYGISDSFIPYCIAAAIGGSSFALGGMVPVSIMIERWFNSHKGLVLGICAAGSGFAAIVAPAIITALIENISLRAAFLSEALFVALIACVGYIILRNDPQNIDLTPYGADNKKAVSVGRNTSLVKLSKSHLYIMCFAMILMGAACTNGLSFLPMLLATSGLDSYKTSMILSFVGIMMTAGKFIYGRMVDKYGVQKVNFLYFILFTIGMISCCFMGKNGNLVNIFFMACFGMGFTLSTIGISITARDMSNKDDYDSVLRNFQTSFMLGALLFGVIPGAIADIWGSYVPSYALMSLLVIICFTVIQLIYRKLQKVQYNGVGSGCIKSYGEQP